MTLRETEWRVLSHESVLQLDEHLWTVQGVVPKTPLGRRITPGARLFLVDDKAAFRSDLLNLSETEGLYCILVAHRDAITDQPGSVLRGVAETV